ncbi:type II toxin-antitoxin system Phd/YefM family antitoxin [Candidatus Nomurabacteria bacterium]|nr:type II toxin-antitoxin system Phd/YefM family antitoxin [Candidatus Nomurabacteria bacterium]
MKQLDRYLKIAQKTGSPVIIHDPKGEDVVLLGLEDYEALLDGQDDGEEYEDTDSQEEDDELEFMSFDDEDDDTEDLLFDEDDSDDDGDFTDELLLDDQENEFDDEGVGEISDPELESLEESLEGEMEDEEDFTSQEDIDDLQAQISAFEEEQKQPQSFAIPISIPSVSKGKGKGTPKRSDEDSWSSAGDVLAERFKKVSSDDEEDFFGEDETDDLDAQGFHYDPTFQEKAQGIPYREVDDEIHWEENMDAVEEENDPVFYEEPV